MFRILVFFVHGFYKSCNKHLIILNKFIYWGDEPSSFDLNRCHRWNLKTFVALLLAEHRWTILNIFDSNVTFQKKSMKKTNSGTFITFLWTISNYVRRQFESLSEEQIDVRLNQTLIRYVLPMVTGYMLGIYKTNKIPPLILSYKSYSLLS